MSSISNIGLTLTLTSGLQAEQQALSLLSQQVSSNQKYQNLTQYTPTEAHNILDFQNAITQRQSYISSIQAVQNRLSLYDSSMTDMESLASDAQALASQNPSYDATKAADIKQQAETYLRQLQADLNQQIGGRYVYAGTRYNTEPVTDLTALTGTPSATTTTSPALPAYDANYSNATAFTVNSGQTPSGTFTMGDTTINWGNLEGASATSPVSITVNGISHTVAVSGLSTAATPAAYAANLSATLNAIAGSAYAGSTGVPSTFSSTASSGTVTMNFGGTAATSVTPDAGGTSGQISWTDAGSPDGTVAQTPNTSTAAYTADQVAIDSNYKVTYGVSSDDPAFQKLVNGLRSIVSAVNAGQSGDTAGYQTYMLQAASLLGDGLTSVQTLHANVAANQNTLKNELTTQNNNITTLQNQLGDIQNVDLSAVGTQINLLQTQLQASYSATASVQKLSLVNYL